MPKYQGITPRAFVSPRAAVKYIVRMDPRAAALPLAVLVGALGMLAGTTLVGLPIGYAISWLGESPDYLWAVPAAGLLAAVSGFTAALRHFRRRSPSLHARAAVLVLLGVAGPVTVASLLFVACLFWRGWASPLALIASIALGLMWWPAFVIVCERRLYRAGYDPRAFCAACGYSLVGLPEPRCPECGLEAPPA